MEFSKTIEKIKEKYSWNENEVAAVLGISSNYLKEMLSGTVNEEIMVKAEELCNQGIPNDYNAIKEQISGEKNKGWHLWRKIPYPLIVLVVYIAIGFLLDYWNPGYALFFSIPMYYSFGRAIFFKNLLNISYFSIVCFVFMLVTIIFDIAHPFWIIFLTIPLYYSVINTYKTKRLSRFFYFDFVLIIYLSLGFTLELWHPLWIIFISVFTFHGICRIGAKKTIYEFPLLSIVTIIYLLLGFYVAWHPWWIIFIIPIVFDIIKICKHKGSLFF